MTAHVYLRLVGFGCAVVPNAPFRIARAARQPRRLRVQHNERSELLDFTDRAPASNAVATVTPAPLSREWMIQTSLYSVPWPVAFDIVSTDDPSSPAGFDLVREDGALIFMQGPLSRRPTAVALAAPGQTMIASAEREPRLWVRFAYEINRVAWEQSHIVVPLRARWLVLTTQARRDAPGGVFEAALEMADQLRVRQE